jgi:drug/metabolite transporter (DMT)-like permease
MATTRTPTLTTASAPAGLATAVLTAATMVAFASNSLLCRAALEGGHADAASFTLLRLGSGAIALVLLARARGGPEPSAGGAWGSAVALFAYAIAFSLAYRWVPAGVGALLLFAAVQLTMVLAGLRTGERPRAVEWAGHALSVAGVVVLTRPGLERVDPVGAALMLLAGAAWGVYSLRGRGAGPAVARNAASFARAVPLALLAGGVAVALGVSPRPGPPSCSSPFRRSPPPAACCCSARPSRRGYSSRAGSSSVGSRWPWPGMHGSFARPSELPSERSDLDGAGDHRRVRARKVAARGESRANGPHSDRS